MPALLHPMPAALSRVRLCACLVAALMLTGCMGGTIAQQVARSVAMQVADKALDHALDEPKPQGPGITNNLMMSSSLDPYQMAFLQAELPTLPAIPETPPPPPQPEPGASATPIVTRLATVQVWSVLLGDEKRSLLENIRDLKIAPLPPEQAWDRWQLAEGGIPGESNRSLLILVPPELGKLRSGDHAVIELGMANGFYIARDRLE